MWRHGDVLIATVEAVPVNARRRSDVILAYGEITGHSHQIEFPATAELWELNGQLYLKVVADSARVIHEEHQSITLPRGIYCVWKQREYTPEQIRPVYD
jgi:hypothetical protein